jgi:amino acid transporter
MKREFTLTGVSEILVLVLLIVSILILPRLFKGEASQKSPAVKKLKKLSPRIRVSIILSIAFPLFMALYLKPWEQNLITYLSFGVIPVLAFWAVIWILSGISKTKK